MFTERPFVLLLESHSMTRFQLARKFAQHSPCLKGKVQERAGKTEVSQ